MQIDHHVLRVVLDPAGRPVGASATTVHDDRSYRVAPLDVGPFDELGEVVEGLYDALDIQLRLW